MTFLQKLIMDANAKLPSIKKAAIWLASAALALEQAGVFHGPITGQSILTGIAVLAGGGLLVGVSHNVDQKLNTTTPTEPPKA
jgi:hypothetical protein